jgi:uncharacterized protein YndB with AHSA1/START domain
MRRWLGNEQFPLSTCEMDVRVGGRFRWVFGTPGTDQTMGVSGTFEEVDHPHRLVTIEKFDDFPGPSTNTLELAPLGEDRTAMTLTVRYPDREIRDGWVASGTTGWTTCSPSRRSRTEVSGGGRTAPGRSR